MPDSEDLEKRAAESILGDPSVRGDLTDDEAQPLIEWGVKQATALARQAAAQAAMHTALNNPVETMDESVADLRKLMKRVNRFVAARQEGDPEHLRKTLDRLAHVSQQVFGEAVPQASTLEREKFLHDQADLDNQQVVTHLLQIFAPPLPPPEQLDGPPRPEQLGAPPKPGQLSAPPKPEQLSGPPTWKQLHAAPPEPDDPSTSTLPDDAAPDAVKPDPPQGDNDTP
jgi:hypothetical protein